MIITLSDKLQEIKKRCNLLEAKRIYNGEYLNTLNRN